MWADVPHVAIGVAFDAGAKGRRGVGGCDGRHADKPRAHLVCYGLGRVNNTPAARRDDNIRALRPALRHQRIHFRALLVDVLAVLDVIRDAVFVERTGDRILNGRNGSTAADNERFGAQRRGMRSYISYHTRSHDKPQRVNDRFLH